MLRVGFYRGSGDVITWAIRALTWGPYSHCEIVFSDGECFGASGREPKGVRMCRKPMDVGWDYISVPLTPYQERVFRRTLTPYIGRPFDWRGVLSFLVPWLADDPERYYCSEIVALTFQERLGLLAGRAIRISPNQLYRALHTELNTQ